MILSVLAVGLSACSSRPKPPPAKPAISDNEVDCADENAKPHLKCAAHPTAYFDPNGLLWVVWGQGGRVYASHSTDLGRHFDPPVAVNPSPEPLDTSAPARPKLVANKLRAVYVAWTQANGQVRFSRSLDTGRTFTAPATVSNGMGRSYHRLGALATNARDYIYLAWTGGGETNGQASRAALYYAYSSDGGRSFHPEQNIASSACSCCRVSLRVDPKQLPVLLWRETGGIVLNHFQAKDRPGVSQSISGGNGSTDACEGPALSIVPKFGSFATWAGQNGLLFSSGSDMGKNFSPQIPITQSAAAEPDILADERSINVIWKQTEGSKTILLGQNSWDGGQTWSKPKHLAEAEGETDQAFLLAQQGHHYVAWQTKEQGFRLIPLGD